MLQLEQSLANSSTVLYSSSNIRVHKT